MFKSKSYEETNTPVSSNSMYWMKKKYERRNQKRIQKRKKNKIEKIRKKSNTKYSKWYSKIENQKWNFKTWSPKNSKSKRWALKSPSESKCYALRKYLVQKLCPEKSKNFACRDYVCSLFSMTDQQPHSYNSQPSAGSKNSK